MNRCLLFALISEFVYISKAPATLCMHLVRRRPYCPLVSHVFPPSPSRPCLGFMHDAYHIYIYMRIKILCLTKTKKKRYGVVWIVIKTGLVRLLLSHVDWMRIKEIMKYFDLFEIETHLISHNPYELRAKQTCPNCSTRVWQCKIIGTYFHHHLQTFRFHKSDTVCDAWGEQAC